jgi:uncharacterized protein (TIGR02444 family)
MIIGADSTDMTPTNTDANPFWNFSLAFYALDGVAPACLELQEAEGVDVNVLLFCCWRAWQGIALEPADLQALDAGIAAWREDVVHPIRALRQRLKDYPGVESSRLLIKQAELEAERAQQACMYQKSLSADADTDSEAEVVGERLEHKLQHNLQQFATFFGIEAASLAEFCRHARPAIRGLKADRLAH